MKNLIIILTLLISESAFCNIDTINVKSKIIDVTVFFSGAQITRNANLKLNKGKYLLKISFEYQYRPILFCENRSNVNLTSKELGNVAVSKTSSKTTRIQCKYIS